MSALPPIADIPAQKERDRPFHDSRSPPNACYSIYPLVTTGGGGGALPLPYGAYCAKAVTLKRVTAAAVSNASAFMAPSFVMTTENRNRPNNAVTSAEKTH